MNGLHKFQKVITSDTPLRQKARSAGYLSVKPESVVHVVTDDYCTYMKVSVHVYPNLGGMVLHHEHDVLPINKSKIYKWAEKRGLPVYHWGRSGGLFAPHIYSPSGNEPNDPRVVS
jgi:hypothetical protein